MKKQKYIKTFENYKNCDIVVSIASYYIGEKFHYLGFTQDNNKKTNMDILNNMFSWVKDDGYDIDVEHFYNLNDASDFIYDETDGKLKL